MYFVRKYWNVINGFEILITVKCDSCGKGTKKMCKKMGVVLGNIMCIFWYIKCMLKLLLLIKA